MVIIFIIDNHNCGNVGHKNDVTMVIMLTAVTTDTKREYFHQLKYLMIFKWMKILQSRSNFVSKPFAAEWKLGKSYFFQPSKVLIFVTIVLSDEYLNARDNQQRFLEKNSFSRHFPNSLPLLRRFSGVCFKI